GEPGRHVVLSHAWPEGVQVDDAADPAGVCEDVGFVDITVGGHHTGPGAPCEHVSHPLFDGVHSPGLIGQGAAGGRCVEVDPVHPGGPGVEFQDGGGQLVEPGDDLHRVGQVLGATDGGGDRFGQWPAGAGLQQQYGGQRPTQDGRGGAAALGEHGVPPGQAGELLLGQDLQIAGATVGGVADHGAAGGPVAEQV